jgi:peptidyl-prolyl cis-trans isomerase B (cyclophilin B)
VVSPADQEVVNSILQGDTIKTVVIEGDTADLFESRKERIQEWNSILG